MCLQVKQVYKRPQRNGAGVAWKFMAIKDGWLIGPYQRNQYHFGYNKLSDWNMDAAEIEQEILAMVAKEVSQAYPEEPWQWQVSRYGFHVVHSEKIAWEMAVFAAESEGIFWGRKFAVAKIYFGTQDLITTGLFPKVYTRTPLGMVKEEYIKSSTVQAFMLHKQDVALVTDPRFDKYWATKVQDKKTMGFAKKDFQEAWKNATLDQLIAKQEEANGTCC